MYLISTSILAAQSVATVPHSHVLDKLQTRKCT